tara:strand:+ start:71 stop:931 length:861 start_codon:yes stop_codon:yes gene_type:complete
MMFKTGLMLLFVVASTLLLAVLANPTGQIYRGLPLMPLLALLIFIVQWLGFIHAWLNQSERYYDLIGSLSYIAIVLLALIQRPELSPAQIIIAGAVMIWALRLGSFLFLRIRDVGEDHRFRHIKKSAPRFLFAWTLQGAWIVITSLAAVAAIASSLEVNFSWIFGAGLTLWVSGFALEVIADAQKSTFRRNPENRDKFISNGLWGCCRHPNYLGEIMLWIGIAIMAIPFISGWQWAILVSPLFVIFLLTKVSGIPTLAQRGQKRWGDDPAYQQYLRDIPLLIPRGH